MFFKTIIASIIAALLAGGVVYFGMPGEPMGEGSVSLRTSQQSAQTQDRPTASNQTPQRQDRPQTQAEDERLIDKLVTNPLRKIIRPEPSEKASSPNGPTGFTQTPDTTKTWVTRDEVQNTPENTTRDELPVQQKRPRESAPETDAPRYYVLEKGELKEIDVLPGPTTTDAINPDASFRILTVTEQAKQISQPDLRDRAFLDIVDYAVTEELYTASVSAMEQIKQVELRDTARSRIAIAYARSGDSRAAFGLIDDVEVDELRDVLRLQVIEAMILPERLPEALQ